jgi:zinc protease
MFVRRILAIAIGLAFFPAISLAAQAAPESRPRVDIAIPDIPYTMFKLKNGLTVLVHEDHKTPVVAVNTWYHVGSKNERPGKTGFAHLFEHLMFSGSENFNNTYISALQRIGATDMNGTTNTDRTNYFENVPTSMLDYALFAESDRMGYLLPVLDQKKLDLQRGVVQNEKRQGENQPYGVTRQLLTENTFPAGHPYSWTTIGSMADLDAASIADVQEWFKTNYGPNNVVLVLAGDITPEQAKEKVEKYYGDIPAGPPLAHQEEWIAKRSGTHRSTVADRVPQGRIYRSWNVPAFGTQDGALLDLAAYILGDGKTSRLYKRLVYKDQVATGVSAYNESREIAGIFSMVLTAQPGGDLARMEKEGDEELQKILKDGVSEAELQTAKTAILADYTRIVERIGGFGGKSDLLARCTTFTGKPDCYKDYLKTVKAATPASIKKAMNEWLSDGDYVLTVTPYPTNFSTMAKLDRSKGPAEGHAESLKLPPMETATLPNGLKLVVAERHSAPVVDFSLMLDAGYSSDKPDMTGLASLTNAMLDEGTAKRDALKIGEEFETLGAQYSSSVNLDGAFINLNTLKATMPQALDVYADVILHPAFSPADFARLKKDRLAAIAREKTVPQSMATRVLPGLLFGKDHPYGYPLSGNGSEAAVTKMTREDLVNYHKAWFKPNNAKLLVVGDTTLAEIKPLVEKAFAGWAAGEVPKKTVTLATQPEKSVVYLLDRPGSQQSTIVAAQLAPPMNAPDAIPLALVNEVFGGSFSARINMNLREDKHWSYGVRAQLLNGVNQRTYASFSPVQTDKTKEALAELVKEYHGIVSNRPITADELKDAQSNQTLALPGSLETDGAVARSYSNVLQYKLPMDYFNTVTAKVLALTPDQVNLEAKQAILPDRLVWVIVGDMSKIEAGVRELNLGEVRKIDVDGNLLK